MDLTAWTSWLRIFRDALIVSVGTFMLVYETVFARTPNVELIGAGLVALGLPPVLRLDVRRTDDSNDDDDKWSHLP